MDQFLLQAVASEASGRLIEQEVLRVSHLGQFRYLLRFATAAHDNLLISVRPDLPRLHLVRALRLREEPQDRFAAFLDQEIGGAILVGLATLPWDRVIEMHFRLPRRGEGAEQRRVVVELVGRSSNILVLDQEGTILGHCRDLRSAFRAPAPGSRYEPPMGRDAYAGLPVGREALPFIRERFAAPIDFLAPLSPRLARDLDPESAGAGEDPWRRLEAILEAARAAAWSPVVYSARPLESLLPGEAPEKDDLVVCALPLRRPPGQCLVSTPFGSPSDAAEACLGLLERLRDFRALKEHHSSLVRRESQRLELLIGKLQEEMKKARDSETYRRLGEALLAGLGTARVEGRTALVSDPYAPEGAPLVVPIDPALPLKVNAQVLFARYKKGKRGVATIETRLRAARRRLEEWRALAAPARDVRGPQDLDRLREEMSRLGLVHAPKRKKSDPPRRAREAPARVRSLTSRDGLVILVGKSGEENDTLTFRVASPWDFWLHAADHPGAHVVVRNPQRLKSLPEGTLRTAAEVAAFYSGAREEGKVEVHYTQRKHVHKRKGMPGGQVLLRRFRSIQVTPRLPTSTLEDV
ncbi:MAG TPA: NFACT family protein [Candidatus Polarisedimenticolia bacterium]|nr:NFACT family protein [Candidatus Polarisedimenticolia bacterium]